MKQMHKKPNYLPEQFVVATDKGWVDIRTNEVLEAIPNLIARIADYEGYMKYLDDLREQQDDTNSGDLTENQEMHLQSLSHELQVNQEKLNADDFNNSSVNVKPINTPPTVKSEVAKEETQVNPARTRSTRTKTANTSIVVK